MSYSEIKNSIKSINSQARSANWLARAYSHAAIRSLTARQKGGTIRIVAIVLSLLFFHYFPMLVLASYMSWEGFFSYDMFEDGLSGATAFYWWAEAMLIVGSAYVAGSLYFIIESKIESQKWFPYKSGIFWSVLVVNILMLFLMFGSNWKNQDGFTKEHLFYTWIICVWIAVHVAIVLNGRGKAALRSLLLGVVLLASISVFQPGALAFPYSLSLQYFGNGGGLLATVKLSEIKDLIHGRLVINSPEHVYLYQDGKNSISIIARKDIELITINNLSGFGHGKSKKQ